MPPKPKYTKEEIIDAAFSIARTSGAEAVTARQVGDFLGCSSRPIFTFFAGMKDLLTAVRQKAFDLMNDYLKVAEDYIPTFKKRGLQVVAFAENEPNLFKLLFLDPEESRGFDRFVAEWEVPFAEDIAQICTEYRVTKAQAEGIFAQLLLTAFGIGMLRVSGSCTFSEEEILRLFGEGFAGSVLFQKSDIGALALTAPVPKDSAEGQALSNRKLLLNGGKTNVKN